MATLRRFPGMDLIVLNLPYELCKAQRLSPCMPGNISGIHDPSRAASNSGSLFVNWFVCAVVVAGHYKIRRYFAV